MKARATVISVASTFLKVRRSQRAKRLRLAVKPGLIELVIPPGASEAQAQAFLTRHLAWAEGKLRELEQKASSISEETRFTCRPSVPWRGKDLALSVREAPGVKVRVEVDETVHITLPHGLGESRDAVAMNAFHAWARRWLHARASQLADRHARLYGLHPRAIRIKRMKTRWGSCGPRNDINLNWLLALAPEPVLEYVVVHELCHIAERNHSPAFWSLVGRHLPDYLEQRQWLRAHGAGLMRRFGL